MSTPFEISDRLVDEMARANPILGTFWGVEGVDHGSWGRALSLEGLAGVADIARRYRDELRPHLDHPDPAQRLAAVAVSSELDALIADYEIGAHFRQLRHLGGLMTFVRNVFDVMPTDTPEQAGAIARRLDGLEGALADARVTAAAGMEAGIMVARRQARSVIGQLRHLAGEGSAYDGVAARIRGVLGGDRVDAALARAKAAAAGFADWLEAEYLPRAPEADGVGAEYYRYALSELVGKDVDPIEAYAWGWEELARLIGEMERVGEQILPGAGWPEVRRHLDTDPSGVIHTTDELLAFVREVLDRAVDDLSGRHFDVPDAIRPLEVRLAPPGGALGVYYMGPSEDLSRPGSVWYAVPPDGPYPLYQHRSTAYHEGFPGHHLQIATVVHNRDRLSRAHRLLVGTSGYAEGWGMYAEVLMGEFGYLSDPAPYFGMLSKQMYRASRVVVDIGLHLGLTIDGSSAVAPGEPWSYENAIDFMEHYGMQSRTEAEAEVMRYLGWPGQAPTYKLGEREFLAIREETRRRLGADFDLKEFHTRVLTTGPMRFDDLRAFLL
ncbi:MAG: DUF885 domain-containing protein [Actinomycetes bacterium]|jgi:uncharacterized protein (DUF885 family)